MKKILALLLLTLPYISCKKSDNATSYATVMGRMGITMGQAYACGHYDPRDSIGTITFYNDTSIEEYSNAMRRSIKFRCHFFLDSSKIGYLNACYSPRDSASLATAIGGDAAAFPFAALALKKLELVNYASAILLGGPYGFAVNGITPANNLYIVTH